MAFDVKKLLMLAVLGVAAPVMAMDNPKNDNSTQKEKVKTTKLRVVYTKDGIDFKENVSLLSYIGSHCSNALKALKNETIVKPNETIVKTDKKPNFLKRFWTGFTMPVEGKVVNNLDANWGWEYEANENGDSCKENDEAFSALLRNHEALEKRNRNLTYGIIAAVIVAGAALDTQCDGSIIRTAYGKVKRWFTSTPATSTDTPTDK
jgi:hypothetical protein